MPLLFTTFDVVVQMALGQTGMRDISCPKCYYEHMYIQRRKLVFDAPIARCRAGSWCGGAYAVAFRTAIVIAIAAMEHQYLPRRNSVLVRASRRTRYLISNIQEAVSVARAVIRRAMMTSSSFRDGGVRRASHGCPRALQVRMELCRRAKDLGGR